MELDRRSQMPLHRQLRRRLALAIETGELAPGELLPSVRQLAARVGVNRLTALKALQALRRAGLVHNRRGRGYYVADRSARDDVGEEDRCVLGTPAPYCLPFRSAYSETVRSVRDMPLSFAAGYPDISLLPLKQVRRLFAKLRCQEAEGNDFSYQVPTGCPRLREELWCYLAARGIERREGLDLLVTNGAQHALDLFMRVLPRHSGVAAVETPAYYGALAAVELNRFELVPVEQDGDGLVVASLARRCQERRFDFLYTNPTYNNPTGATLSHPRRASLVALAERFDFSILEDDTYADLGFTGHRPRRLITLAPAGRVCYIGSFSKSFMPGLRMGYIVGPTDLVAAMSHVHGVNDMCSSTLSQKVLMDALASGFYDRHTQRVKRIYRKRCRAMDEALRGELPDGCRYTLPKGGMFYWILLPAKVSIRALKARCNAWGVDFADGPQFSAEGHGGNCIRLNFTLLDEDAIRSGIAVLAREIRRLVHEGA